MVHLQYPLILAEESHDEGGKNQKRLKTERVMKGQTAQRRKRYIDTVAMFIALGDAKYMKGEGEKSSLGFSSFFSSCSLLF